LAIIVPHNEPSLTMTIDLHEAILVLDALLERRKERFGQPFPDGAEVTFEELTDTFGSEEDAEDFLAMIELEAMLTDALQVFEEEEDDEDE
jgi:hypothetical protein